MKNLDQKRAAHALKAAGDIKKEDVNKVPALVINNGLLAAAAFAKAKKGGLEQVFVELTDYLKKEQKIEGDDLIDYLTTKGDSTDLQIVTDEALAYLSFLKRFAKKGPAS